MTIGTLIGALVVAFIACLLLLREKNRH